MNLRFARSRCSFQQLQDGHRPTFLPSGEAPARLLVALRREWRDDAPAAGLVDDVDVVVLAVGAGHAEEQRQPPPEAEPALAREGAVEEERPPLHLVVAPALLWNPVHEHLVRLS